MTTPNSTRPVPGVPVEAIDASQPLLSSSPTPVTSFPCVVPTPSPLSPLLSTATATSPRPTKLGPTSSTLSPRPFSTFPPAPPSPSLSQPAPGQTHPSPPPFLPRAQPQLPPPTFIRVEPKVYFANERTFLSWLNFTILLVGLSLGLLNFGQDSIGRMSGILFTLIAIAMMIYALFLYLKRASMIRKRRGGPYDSKFAPIMVVCVLIAAILVNFSLRLMSAPENPLLSP